MVKVLKINQVYHLIAQIHSTLVENLSLTMAAFESEKPNFWTTIFPRARKIEPSVSNCFTFMLREGSGTVFLLAIKAVFAETRLPGLPAFEKKRL